MRWYKSSLGRKRYFALRESTTGFPTGSEFRSYENDNYSRLGVARYKLWNTIFLSYDRGRYKMQFFRNRSHDALPDWWRAKKTMAIIHQRSLCRQRCGGIWTMKYGTWLPETGSSSSKNKVKWSFLPEIYKYTYKSFRMSCFLNLIFQNFDQISNSK